jgi:hypothetical protein
MTKDQDERIVAAWEALANRLGEWNEIAKTAIAKQWPEPRERRDAVISKLPTEEDKLKAQTGNTSGPIEDWLGEFDPEEEVGPREREWREKHGETGQSKSPARPKASPKASGSGTTST